MTDSSQIRAILFREGDSWIAQCLEYDIGAQADDLDSLQERLFVALDMEYETSLRITGEPFGGIPPAPKHYYRMWSEQSGVFSPTAPAPCGADPVETQKLRPTNDCMPPVKMALHA